MPRVFEDGGYLFHFYSSDGRHPVHAHVRGGGHWAKFWIGRPNLLIENHGFSKGDLSKIRRILKKRAGELTQKWEDIFNE